MGKRTANTNAQAETTTQAINMSATFTITGELESVYVGKKYTYATVKILKPNKYYDRYKVQCSLDFDFPDDGEIVTFVGHINRYKTDISFIDKSCVVSNS